MASDEREEPGEEPLDELGDARLGRAPRSAAHRAAVSVNDLLVGVLEQLLDAQRIADLSPVLRSAVDHLVLEVAKVQGVSEWVAEDLVRLVEDEEPAEEP